MVRAASVANGTSKCVATFGMLAVAPTARGSRLPRSVLMPARRVAFMSSWEGDRRRGLRATATAGRGRLRVVIVPATGGGPDHAAKACRGRAPEHPPACDARAAHPGPVV